MKTEACNNSAAWRVPAEWERDEVVMMSLPHPETDWLPMLDEAIACFRAMIEAIAPHARLLLLVPDIGYAQEKVGDLIDRFPDRVIPAVVPTNDTWTRDYGPVTIEHADGSVDLLDFTFNGWGLKFAANHDNCANRVLEAKKVWRRSLESRLDIVLEGGSIDSDGEGLMLTTSECLLSPNRNPLLSREQIEQRLVEEFRLRKLLWIDHGYLAGDDTDSHVDTLARFAPGRQIVYVECTDREDEHYEALEAMKRDILALTDADGRPFNTVALPLPDPVFHPDDGHRLPATYANFLVLRDVVVMPSYDQPMKDMMAAGILEMAYERPVVSVDCRALIRQHGSLHCSTMQLPAEALII